MDGRILVIVPSRGRPERLAYMLGEALSLSDGIADFAVCTDEDDESGYGDLAPLGDGSGGRVLWFRGHRKSMCAWTNLIAAHPRACRYGMLASLGDDHVPRTQGWDGKLATAVMAGAGIAYGDDLHQRVNLPTAPVIARAITDALGWMCLPGLVSKYCDDVWKRIGQDAGCLSFLPEVVIEHVHPDAGKASRDPTYAAGNDAWPGDERVFRLWERTGAAADAATVRCAMARRAAVA